MNIEVQSGGKRQKGKEGEVEGQDGELKVERGRD